MPGEHRAAFGVHESPDFATSRDLQWRLSRHPSAYTAAGTVVRRQNVVPARPASARRCWTAGIFQSSFLEFVICWTAGIFQSSFLEFVIWSRNSWTWRRRPPRRNVRWTKLRLLANMLLPDLLVPIVNRLPPGARIGIERERRETLSPQFMQDDDLRRSILNYRIHGETIRRTLYVLRPYITICLRYLFRRRVLF